MGEIIRYNFSPSVFSKQWLDSKFRSNLLRSWHSQVVYVLESGLLFREDSNLVEDGVIGAELVSRNIGVTSDSVFAILKNKEVVLSAVSVGAFAYFLPLAKPIVRQSSSNLIRLSIYACVPAAIHFSGVFRNRFTYLRTLIEALKDYTALSRRCMARMRDYKLIGKMLTCSDSVVETVESLLISQQMELSLLLIRLTSTVLACFAWLEEDITLNEFGQNENNTNILKTHHAFLVLQSAFLRIVGLAHFPVKESFGANHNERLYWLHSFILPDLYKSVTDKRIQLFRAYQLIKNVFGSSGERRDARRPPVNGVEAGHAAQSCSSKTVLRLGVALQCAERIDTYLDTCWTSKTDVDHAAISEDFEMLANEIEKCANDIEAFRVKLKRILKGPELTPPPPETDAEITSTNAVSVVNCDEAPVIRDEVFYWDQSQIESSTSLADTRDNTADLTTGPGADEIKASKIVLKELQKVLVEREDKMRVREAKALRETMPELKDVPEFPRQLIKEKSEEIPPEDEGKCKKKDSAVPHVNGNKPENCEFIGDSGDSLSSGDESLDIQPLQVNDVKNRVRRKKNYPSRRHLVNSNHQDDLDNTTQKLEDIGDTVQDESQRPMEYRFGTGMALASMMQRAQNLRPLLSEEIFDGEGEVETDSGNDEQE